LHFSFLAIAEGSVHELSTYSRIEFSPTLIALCNPQVLFWCSNTVPTYVHTTDVWHFFAQYLFILARTRFGSFKLSSPEFQQLKNK
jgi:hypothetical protein